MRTKAWRGGVLVLAQASLQVLVAGQCLEGEDDCFATCSRFSHIPRTAEALERSFGCNDHPCFTTDETRQNDVPDTTDFDSLRECAPSTARSRCYVQAPLGHFGDLRPALEIEGWSAYLPDGTPNTGGRITSFVMSALYIPEAISANRYCHGNTQQACEDNSEDVGISGPELATGEPALACRWIELPEETAVVSHAIFTGSEDSSDNDAGISGSIAFEEHSIPRLCHSGSVGGGRGGRTVSSMAPLVTADDVACIAGMLGSKGVTTTMMIHANLAGLPQDRVGTHGFAWRAHEFPYQSECSLGSLGGHYRPLGHYYADCVDLEREETCDPDQQLCGAPTVSFEERARLCEVGDFSGKHGNIWPTFEADGTSHVDIWVDEGQDGVPLSGPLSVVGTIPA